MHLHEYQAKSLLQRYNIPIQPFCVASSVEEVDRAIKEQGWQEAVVKVQIHAGGRGKAGGVKFAKSPEEIIRYAEQMLGMTIVTPQTDAKGIVVQKVLISLPATIKKEYYLAAVIDRSSAQPMIIASAEGGMEIEEIAQKKPECIVTEPIGLQGQMHSFRLLRIAKAMGWEGEMRKKGMELVANFARAFIKNDVSLLEINPLAQTEEGNILAIDAKCTIDDNALYRQPALAQWYDPEQLPENEAKAREFGLSYVGLDGDIGCMVNGAGLAMSTMDIIAQSGGRPANFLDVGGDATQEKIEQGFKLILLDPNVKVIFVNIFGGIVDCAVLAEGIVQASRQDQVKVALIVRLEGTNSEEGKNIVEESHLNITLANTMEEGAQKAHDCTHQ